MVAPPSESLFRPLSEAHVQELEAAILANPDSNFTVMVANIDCDQKDIDLDRLEEPGAYTYSIIGGNHTRMPLQNLMEQDNTSIEKTSLWPVRLYAGLSVQKCLFMGYQHNQIHQLGRSPSFTDIVGLFRKVFFDVSGLNSTQEIPQIRQKTLMEWKDALASILKITVSVTF